MTGNISYLSNFEPFDGKRTIKTECIVLGRDFKLLYDAHILLRTPRQHNMYSIDLNNIVPHRDLTCLVAKASADECNLWHRRLVVDAGTHSTNFSGHEEHLESTSSQPQGTRNTDVPESSGNSNNTATSTIPLADQLGTQTMETPIPTDSSPVPTVCFSDSQEPSSATRLISKRVTNQEEIPSLDNIPTLTNQFEDILGDTSNSEESNGVEADVSYIETTITASPTPTLRIHRDHPKTQIIGPVDTPIQTRNKSKEVGEQIFIATIHQKTDLALLQFCLFSCFLSQVEPKRIFDALQDPSWVEAMQEELLQFKIQKVWSLVDYPKGPLGFQDLEYPARVYIVEKAMYGLHQAPRAWYGDILKKFGYSDVKSSNTPMDKENPWGKDDIMFAVCACARHQVTPKEFHLHSVKRIFRYLKGHPKLGLWYPKDSPFDLVAYSDSDYGGASQDRKSTSGGCQFLVKNPVYHSKTKHIEIRHHFIRYCFEKKLINVDHIHTDENVSDLLIKPFDVGRFQYLAGEGSGTPTEPHHTPSQEAQPSLPTHISTSLIPTVIPIPTVTQTEPTPLREYTRRGRIAQFSALPPVADKPASPVRVVSKGEACPTDSDFIADQDRATIAKSSTLPYDTAPRVTSPAAVEVSMQQTINELTALCTSLRRQHSALLVQFKAQKVEINKLKERVKVLEDNQGVIGARSTDDVPIKERRIDEEEGITGRVSTDTEEIRMDEGEAAVERTSEDTKEMATVLTSMDVATVLVGGIDVPTGSYSIPTTGPPAVDIHTGSEVVPTSSSIVATATVVTPYSRRKGKEVMVESDTPKKQRDAEVVRIHAEEELQVWKLVEDFIPMGSKEEAERLKRKWFNLEQEKAKKQKTSEEVLDKEKSSEEIHEEKVKEMMQLVPIEEVYVQALQIKHPIIHWKVHIEGQRNYWKIIRLGGSSACYQLFMDLLKHLDREDLNQLWVLVKEYLSIRPASSNKEMELWKLQLSEPNELRDQAYENSLICKEKMKKLHDSKIKNRIFNVGPFTITKVFPYGTIELSQKDGPNFKVRILQKSQEKSQKPDKNGHENGKNTQDPDSVVQTSSAGATQILSSGNTSSLAVAKYTSSGIFITSSGNDLSILFLTILLKLNVASPIKFPELNAYLKRMLQSIHHPGLFAMLWIFRIKSLAICE
nr:hypothetical protein [Tanacetum cinerariifolium]